MRVFIQRLGHFKVVLLLTTVAILLSLTISLLIVHFFLRGIDLVQTAVLATAIPLVIAPFITWPLVKLLIKVHNLEEEMRTLATTDSLTGLQSRSVLINQARLWLERSNELQQPCAIIMIDLDHFKKINDRYGHHTGDEVLRSFGRITQQITREEDLAGRMGGEEFLIMLPNTTKEKAVQFTQRLHRHIRASTVFSSNGRVKFTASMGVSVYQPDRLKPASLDDLFSQADQALYMAKNNGRDHTVSYTEVERLYSIPKPALVAI